MEEKKFNGIHSLRPPLYRASSSMTHMTSFHKHMEGFARHAQPCVNTRFGAGENAVTGYHDARES